jgi:hypothetical protein
MKLTNKPMVFIGSSGEASKIAHAIKKELEADLEAIVWNDDIFELGEDTLSSLLKFVSIFDFAIFVMSDDDLVRSRGWFSRPAPRDNVVFELGLFMGAMGKRRSFPVVVPPKKGRLKTPSDLLGNTEIRLTSRFHTMPLADAVKESCARLRETIISRSKEAYLQLLPSTGLAVGYFKNFLIPACNALAITDSINVNGATIDISKDNFDFNIILPNSLSVASPEGATKYFKNNSLVSVSLPTTGRPYPLHVDAAFSGDRLQIFDYPTTLGASHEAIKIALASTFLGYSEHHQILDNKEIENFRRTVEILLKEPGAAGFADNIKIKRL